MIRILARLLVAVVVHDLQLPLQHFLHHAPVPLLVVKAHLSEGRGGD